MRVEREPVTVVNPGDLHLSDRDQDNFAASIHLLKKVNELVRPNFVQFIGDNVQDATDGRFRLFGELRGLLSVSHFAFVSDHDVVQDPKGDGFRRWVGEPRGSFSLRRFRFLRLNTLDVPRSGFFRRATRMAKLMINKVQRGECLFGKQGSPCSEPKVRVLLAREFDVWKVE